MSLSPLAESNPESAAPLGHDGAESSSLSRPWLTAAEREDFTHRSVGKGLAIFAIEYAAVIVFAALAVAQLPIFLNIAAGLLDGYLVGALFVVGHDAAHQSFTPYRRLNTWIARLAMLPASYNSALWVHSHNRIHHRYTNLLGSDYVWAPMTPDAYRRARPFRRFVYRLYRARLGAIPYAITVMWWQKNFLPLAPEYRPKLRSYMFDTAFVAAGWLGYGAFIGWMGSTLAPDRPLWLTLSLGWIFPWVTWNWAFGWTTFLHHTHPEVPWFSDPAGWSRHRVQVLGTIHVDVPLALDIISNRIMDHNAHHACPAIPLYNLRRAQRHLLEVFHEVHRIYLTPAKYAATADACKLYDPSQRRWTDFAGHPTGPTLG